MPVLIITGTKDFQIPVSMGERLYNAANELKELIIIQDGGHDNHLSKQHRQKLKDFLAVVPELNSKQTNQ